MTTGSSFSRGSEWYRWEPHIHAPGTVLNDGFGGQAWDAYLRAIETADPPIAAIGITDYCVTSSYERVKNEKEAGRLNDCALVFPNVELRLDTGTVRGNFVNIHLLVSPEDPRHVEELNRFLGRISFHAFDDQFACTPSDLIRLGRRANPALDDPMGALRHGCTQFKVSRTALLKAFSDIEWARNNIIIAVAGGADGSSGVKEAADATLREEIEKVSHAIFASSRKQRDFWLGQGVVGLDELRKRYAGQKPCIWGSDAHELTRVGKPAEDRFCWIKGRPSFDTLRQACIEPERAYVDIAPPSWAASSQIIDQVHIEGASFAQTPQIRLNPGLVAVIGARGSGKTALADMLAVGCDAYVEPRDGSSFLARAREHLANVKIKLAWGGAKEVLQRSLSRPENYAPEAYPRARYLSQQFVEEICSLNGMPRLIREVERVIFNAHASIDRDGAVDFDELLELRAQRFRDARAREEAALQSASEQIGLEIEKGRQVSGLQAQIGEKEKLLARYQAERSAFLPKGPNKHADRLQELTAAAETVRSYLRYYASQQASLAGVRNDVSDVRQNRAPETLRIMKERHQRSGILDASWADFLLEYSGDVNSVLDNLESSVSRAIGDWKGLSPTQAIDASGAFIDAAAKLDQMPLAILEAEADRLAKLVALDRDAAEKLRALSRKAEEENTALARLRERLKDCEGAAERRKNLSDEREKGYVRVFEAVLAEEEVLRNLYSPLMDRLTIEGGTLSKLSFSVARVVNVGAWAAHGEELFDLRGGPLKGRGTLAKEASLGGLWAPQPCASYGMW